MSLMGMPSRAVFPVLVIAGFALTACGTGDPTPGATEASRCEPATPSAVEAIRVSLRDGAVIDGTAYMARSAELEDVWFVSARLTGPGISGIGTWAMIRQGESLVVGRVYSASDRAEQFSDWPPMDEAYFLDDGGRVSRACVAG